MGRKRRAKKPHHLRTHFYRSALDRYDLELGDKEQEELVKKIQENRAYFLDRESKAKTIWAVGVDFADQPSKTILVVYDKGRKELVTALPIEYINGLPKEVATDVRNMIGE